MEIEVVCFIHTLVLAHAGYLSGTFTVEYGTSILASSYQTRTLQTRSEIECVNRCFNTDDCFACSYKGENKSCTIDISGGEYVKKPDPGGYVTAIRKKKDLPVRECSDLPITSSSGIYTVYPTSATSLEIYCDMETDGGGWTVFQRRIDGSVNFYRDWNDYEVGFGDFFTEFWLGNEKIHQITSIERHELRVDLEDFDGNATYAKYSYFNVGHSTTNYTLDVNGYSGTAGDSLSGANGNQFTTLDRDNDVHTAVNCAQWSKGAWWYGACHSSNLNGQYLAGVHASHSDGINWFHWRGHYYSLKSTKMMMRKHN